jgi:glycosyltransferase involved in cell wall biosynthesis
MKLAVDYHLTNARESGMARFIREILGHLKKADPAVELILIDYEDMRALKTKSAKILAIFKELLYTQVTIPFCALKKGWTHLYFPNPPSPFIPLGKNIVLNIPDVSFWVQEKPFLPLRLYSWFLYAASAHMASRITTFSENSARDIVKVLRVSPQKITIIPLGVDEKFFNLQRSSNADKMKIQHGITRPYILCVLGSFVPRKNANDLVDAYAALPAGLKSAVQLVFVGKKGDRHFETLTQYIQSQGVTDDIVFTGLIPEDELLDLYADARLFVFPSKYEGFGLPPIEAMAAGIPTIAYNNSSLPEIIGQAGLLVNDKLELRAAMVRLLNEDPLRNELIAAGKKQAARFTWEKAARALHQVIFHSTGKKTD